LPQGHFSQYPQSAAGMARNSREDLMLYTIAVVLVVLWLLGFLAFHVGPLIHILLVIAIIVVLLRIIQGRRPV
jgi:hypothetical protein